MGLFNQGSNANPNSKNNRKTTIGVSTAILIYIVIVIVFKVLGHWYSDNNTPIILSKTYKNAYPVEVSENDRVGSTFDKKNKNKTPNSKSNKSQFLKNKKSKVLEHNKLRKVKSLQTHILDINIADSTALVSIKGIGIIYARRIIKYRKKLGGYLNINQLNEIYGMTSSNFSKILPFIFVDSTFKPKTISIWTCDFKTLLSHPYCDYKLTKQIFNFKNKKNKGRTMTFTKEEFYLIKDVDTIMFEKLYPYLSFERFIKK